MEKLLQDLYPAIISAAGILIPMIGAYAAYLFKKKTGFDILAAKKAIESGDREALHSALETAAKLAVEKGLIGQEAIDFMLRYTEESSPDAVEGLNPTRGLAIKLASSKLSEEKSKQRIKDIQDSVSSIKQVVDRVTAEHASGQMSIQSIRELNDQLVQVDKRLR